MREGIRRVIRPLIRPFFEGARKAAAYRRVRAEFQEFERLDLAQRSSPARMPLHWSDRKLCLSDRTANTGFDRHYVYHTAWAARVLARTRPSRHVDVGSSLYFAALASAFVELEFLDFRPPELYLNGLRCRGGDLLSLPFESGSISSLSCMHVVEHVGLGRYGDPLDPLGDLKAMRELERVLAPGGSLLFVVPIAARPRVEFNAHRIYSREQIEATFPALSCREFALIPDDARDDPRHEGLVVNPPRSLLEKQGYGCGCFWLTRGSG